MHVHGVGEVLHDAVMDLICKELRNAFIQVRNQKYFQQTKLQIVFLLGFRCRQVQKYSKAFILSASPVEQDNPSWGIEYESSSNSEEFNDNVTELLKLNSLLTMACMTRVNKSYLKSRKAA